VIRSIDAKNHELAPIPAFAEPTPPPDSDLAAILARAERVGIAPERVLLALGYPLDDGTQPRRTASTR
jgi:hypothetical protein